MVHLIALGPPFERLVTPIAPSHPHLTHLGTPSLQGSPHFHLYLGAPISERKITEGDPSNGCHCCLGSTIGFTLIFLFFFSLAETRLYLRLFIQNCKFDRVPAYEKKCFKILVQIRTFSKNALDL